MIRKTVLLPIVIFVLASWSVAQTPENKLRPEPVLEQVSPPPLSAQEQAPTRRVRAYPMAAPTIPHSINGFVVNKDMNQCMMCHEADKAPMMKAPAIAESHYKDRDNNYLTDVSARRYFCTQCHVPQHEAKPVVDNTFEAR